jgi:ribonuclease E
MEIEALKGGGEATLTAPRAVGLYILNEKRAHLARLHQMFGLFVTIVIDDEMAHSECLIERTASETRPDHAAPIAAPAPGTAAAALTDAQLASISRVLAWNDPQAERDHQGARRDRNTELVLLDPRILH